MKLTQWFYRIWKDSVWSKVIASAIIGIALAIWSYLNFSQLKSTLKKIIEFEFNVIYILLIVIFIFLGYRVIIYFLSKRPSKKDLNLKKLQEFNSTNNDDDSIHFTWTVALDNNEKPFVYNIVSYCNLHDFPLRFKNNCKDLSCKNHHITVYVSDFKNWIESALYDDWKKLNQKK